MSDDDDRVLALREVAESDNEYSGWVNLAQGALDVIAELEAEAERLRIEVLEWKLACGQREEDMDKDVLTVVRERDAARAEVERLREENQNEERVHRASERELRAENATLRADLEAVYAASGRLPEVERLRDALKRIASPPMNAAPGDLAVIASDALSQTPPSDVRSEARWTP